MDSCITCSEFNSTSAGGHAEDPVNSWYYFCLHLSLKTKTKQTNSWYLPFIACLWPPGCAASRSSNTSLRAGGTGGLAVAARETWPPALWTDKCTRACANAAVDRVRFVGVGVAPARSSPALAYASAPAASSRTPAGVAAARPATAALVMTAWEGLLAAALKVGSEWNKRDREEPRLWIGTAEMD